MPVRSVVGACVSQIVLLCALSLILEPATSEAQETIEGQGNWEITYNIVLPDGRGGTINGGLLRQRYLTAAECQTGRSNLVKNAQTNLVIQGQEYPPGHPILRAYEAMARITPCRNIGTGQVLGGGVQSGGPGGASGAAGTQQAQQTIDDIVNSTQQELVGRGVGTLVGGALGANAPDELKAFGDFGSQIGGLFGGGSAGNEGGNQASTPDGSWTKTDPDGSAYRGQLLNGRLHGTGAVREANGNTYEGTWQYGRRSGRGSQSYSDGAVYSGEWKDNLRDGNGSLQYANGDVYEGDWKNGLRHGRGVIQFSSGAVYDGEFEDGVFHGLGARRAPSGAYYVGRYRSGRSNGRGVMRFADGALYEGYFRDGFATGQGTLTMVAGGVPILPLVCDVPRGRTSDQSDFEEV